METDGADGELESLPELLAEDSISIGEKKRALGDGEFFRRSPARMKFLVEYTLKADPFLYKAAVAGLGAAMDAGATLGKDTGLLLAEAVRSGDSIVTARVGAIMQMDADRKEAAAVRLMRGLLFEPGPEMDKEAVLHEPSNFGTGPRMDLLVEYALNGEDCGDVAFAEALETYKECSSAPDSKITSKQVSMMGRSLASDTEEVRRRADKLLMVAASKEPWAVLNNAQVGMEKKGEIAGNTGIFAARLPRSLDALIDFMMQDGVRPGDGAGKKAMNTFRGFLKDGVKLADDHINRIAKTMLDAPSEIANPKRKDMDTMLAAILTAGVRIPELSRRKIMNAATEEWPNQDEAKREDAKERKFCALRVTVLVLEDWLRRLKEYKKGDCTETHWYFRAEDKRDLTTDAMHPDQEIKGAARRARDLAADIEAEIFNALVHGSMELAQSHATLVARMVIANTSLDVMKEGHRERALKMLQWMVKNGMDVPRQVQLEIAVAAGGMLPDKDGWDYEFAKNRKFCAMQALEALLGRMLASCMADAEKCEVEWPLEHRHRCDIVLSAAVLCEDNPAALRDMADSAKRIEGLINEIDTRMREVGAGVGELALPTPTLKGGRAARSDRILVDYLGKEGGSGESEEGEMPSGTAVARASRPRGAPVEVNAPANPRDPRREGDFPEAETTLLVLDPARLAREAIEAAGDKPGLPPGVERALRRMEEGRRGDAAKGRIPPAKPRKP